MYIRKQKLTCYTNRTTTNLQITNIFILLLYKTFVYITMTMG